MARHEAATANIVASSTSVLQLVKVIGSSDIFVNENENENDNY